MIGILTALLIRCGLDTRRAGRLAPILLGALAIAVLAAIGALWIRQHDAAVVAHHEASLDARAAPAAERAAEDRAADEREIREEEQAYHDAIANSGADGPPDNASIALGCERLHRAGIPLPAAC